MRATERCAVALLLGLAPGLWMGCSEPQQPQGTSSDPPAPAQPLGLEQAEASVQAQHQRVRAQFEQQRAAAESEQDLSTAFGDLGRWYLAHGFHLAAESSLQSAAELQPTEPRWPYFLATIHRLEGRWQEAIQSYQQVLELSSPSSYVPALLWWASIELEHHRLQRADELYQHALALQPNNAVALHGRAKGLLAVGQADAAVTLLQQALEAQPQTAVLVYSLAQAELARGQQGRAEALLATLPDDNREHRRLRLADPWMHDVELLASGVAHHLQAGRQARREGNMQAAVKHFRDAVATAPEHLEARLAMARLEIDLGRPRRARPHLDAASKLQPGDSRTQWLRVRAAILLGELQAAERILQQALQAEPAHPQGRLLLANLRLKQQRHTEALELLDELQRQRPEDPQVAHAKVLCLWSMGRADEALRALDAARQQMPNEPILLALAKHLDSQNKAGPRLAQP